jgi:hypothetical protein
MGSWGQATILALAGGTLLRLAPSSAQRQANGQGDDWVSPRSKRGLEGGASRGKMHEKCWLVM